MRQSLLRSLALAWLCASPALADEAVTLIYGQDPVDKKEVKMERTASQGKPIIEVMSAAVSTAINPISAVAQKPGWPR